MLNVIKTLSFDLLSLCLSVTHQWQIGWIMKTDVNDLLNKYFALRDQYII